MKRARLVGLVIAMAMCFAAAATARVMRGGSRTSAAISPADAPIASSEGNEPADLSADRPAPGSSEGRPSGAVLRLEGQAIDSDDLPVADVSVVLAGGDAPRAVLTSSDGIFRFVGLSEGTFRLFAHTQDRFAGPVSVRVTAVVEPVTLRMRAASSIRVVVADGRTGVPLEGVRVESVDLVDVATTTDATGSGRLNGLSPGPHELHFERDGYAPLTRQLLAPQRTATPPPTNVRLEPGCALSGRVVDDRGEGVSEARVHLEGAAAAERATSTSSEVRMTDRQGGFVFPWVGSGSVQVVAEHDVLGFGHSDSIRLDGLRAHEGVEVRLERGSALNGRVVTHSGSPAPGAVVRVAPVGTDLRTGRQAVCDPGGVFHLSGLARSILRVIAVREAASSAPEIVDPVRAGSLTLTLDGDGSIRGFVVTPAGEAVSDAQVAATPEGPSDTRESVDPVLFGVASAVTGADGAFSLVDLSAGRYRVRASRSSALDSSAMWLRPGTVVTTGTQTARIVLDADATVRGRILFTDGTAPDAFTVALTLSPPESFGGDGGRFELGDVPAGTHSLTINGPGVESKFIDGVAVQPGEVTDLGTVEVRHARSLRGRVVRGDGSPVAGATVTVAPFVLGGVSAGATGGNPAGASEATSDADGNFVVAGIGRIPLVATADHPVEGRSVASPVPQDVEEPRVDLVVRPSGALEGVVRRDATPVPGATVVATRPATNRARFAATTDEDGHYRIDPLAASDYVVTAIVAQDATRNAQCAHTVSIPSDGTQTLDFDLPAGKVDVTVSLVARSTGRAIPNAQAYLLSGVVTADSAGQLETAVASRGAGATYMTHSVGGAPARFEDVPPASYSLCVVAIFSDLRDPRAVQRVQRQAALLPAACVPFQVTDTAGPEQQSTVWL
jgi:hypothetical protein